jgi:hypothetical protein
MNGASVASRPYTRLEILQSLVYIALLVCVNAYICRELFYVATAHMYSMHGTWAAIAHLAEHSWFRPTWWPYWDCGIPFEFTYAPLIPALTAALASLRGIPELLAFQSVSGIGYCMVPVSLFLLAWIWTRAPGYSFGAALLYSLTSPTQLLAPDEMFSLQHFWDARRLYVVGSWDETPHVTALALLPLIILFLSLAIRKRGMGYAVIAAALIAVATWASVFGPIMVASAVLCLLFALKDYGTARNVGLMLGVGAGAYALSAAFLPPSLILAIRKASSVHGEPGWTMGSFTAIVLVALGWSILWRYLPPWTTDWRLQFFALFAYLTSSIPLIAAYLHRQFLPQPTRYKFEMELGLALLVVFSLRVWIERLPVRWRAGLALLLLALAGEQVVNYREWTRNIVMPEDVTKTIEYRTSAWAAQNLGGMRLMMPGSIAQWGTTYTKNALMNGGSFAIAYSLAQEGAVETIYKTHETGDNDFRITRDWLRAFGAGAVAVSGPHSQEYWKPFEHPDVFKGRLPLLWEQDDVAIYRVSERPYSLAHVVDKSSVVKDNRGKLPALSAVEPYVAQLDDPSNPPANLWWEGRNGIKILAETRPGQVISVQESYHPGWRALVNGSPQKINRDGLCFMWLEPGGSGAAEVELTYTGGVEWWICRVINAMALILLVAFFPCSYLVHRYAPDLLRF